jgi:hypothetical protein
MKLEFSGQIFEKYSCIKLLKNAPVGAELFHADRQTKRQIDGQTDMTKLIVAYRSFANAPKTNNFNGCVLGFLYSTVFKIIPKILTYYLHHENVSLNVKFKRVHSP